MTAQPSARAMPTNMKVRILPNMPGLRLMAMTPPAVAMPMPMAAPPKARPMWMLPDRLPVACASIITFLFVGFGCRPGIRCRGQFKKSMTVFLIGVRAQRADKGHHQHRKHKCLHHADERLVKIHERRQHQT